MLILLVLLIILMMIKDIYYYLSFLILMEFVHVIFLFMLVGTETSIWVFVTFLVYSVCEGILGLLVLISMNNEFGHQKMKFLNLMI